MAYAECHLKEWQGDCLLPSPHDLSTTLNHFILYHFARLDSLVAVCLESKALMVELNACSMCSWAGKISEFSPTTGHQPVQADPGASFL